jgi:hypothetical protein
LPCSRALPGVVASKQEQIKGRVINPFHISLYDLPRPIVTGVSEKQVLIRCSQQLTCADDLGQGENRQN